MHDSERDQPTAANHYRILQKLAYVIAALAPEYPKFVEQKMASDADEVRYRYGDQGRQKTAKDKHHGKVDQRHGSAYRTKTDKPKNSFLIQHRLILEGPYAVLGKPELCNRSFSLDSVRFSVADTG
jgi:hypothetical protein